MIRIPIIIIALYFSIVGALAQNSEKKDSSSYESRKLKIEEVNFATSYYHQEGNNAAVTGGIGSEKLTDAATTLELKLTKAGRGNRQHSFSVDLGIDFYTSASSDKIDPSTISSASSSDVRVYPSASWTVNNPDKNFSWGLNGSVSSEYDYLSTGGGISMTKSSRDRNREIGVKLQAFIDQVTIIYPIELRPAPSNINSSRNTYAATFTLSQIINKRLHLMLLLDVAQQQGYLSLPFNRVYFNDASVAVEKLPDNRFKIPIGLRANYFLGDRVILRGFYRYYQDNWGLNGHTAELETTVKITPFLSASPFYRYYNQHAVDYFAPYQQHSIQQSFYTSDFDLSGFNSHFAGVGVRFVSPDGIAGIQKWNMIEVRYGHYNRSTGLTSNIISLLAKFK
ncbi:MAG: DUF3570 domain-containing protein [Cyclobacteriaceae bacterium]|nr:DUF3570 domain-containing protein [Cyclobacteriaceae bacterium]